jgi:hypothetical protein
MLPFSALAGTGVSVIKRLLATSKATRTFRMGPLQWCSEKSCARIVNVFLNDNIAVNRPQMRAECGPAPYVATRSVDAGAATDLPFQFPCARGQSQVNPLIPQKQRHIEHRSKPRLGHASPSADVGSGAGLAPLSRVKLARAPARYRIEMASPLRSALIWSPTWRPVSDSVVPLSLVSTITCAPRPTAPPTPPAP